TRKSLLVSPATGAAWRSWTAICRTTRSDWARKVCAITGGRAESPMSPAMTPREEIQRSIATARIHSKPRRRTMLCVMSHDIAFEMAVSSIRFGPGVTREVGMDLADLGARCVLVVTDPTLRPLPPVQTVLESLERHRVPFTLYDRVRVEPSDESFL